MVSHLIALFAGAAIVVALGNTWPEATILYKQGQVDCANGRLLFELRTGDHNETSWVRKESQK